MRRISRRDTLITAAAGLGFRAGQGRIGSPSQPIGAEIPDPVRVAIVGLEGHYSEILDVAGLLPKVRVAAVADTNAQRLAGTRQNPRLAPAKTYGDYRRMLDSERCDVVAVCGENAGRAAIVRECAGRGIAIIAEKPLAMNLAELEAARQSLTGSRVPFSMLLPMRCEPQYRGMRSIVQSGLIGDVVAMGAQKSYKLGDRPGWMKSRAAFGGAIPYIGIHMVDLMRWIGGREFKSAAAFQSNVGAPQVGEMENNVAAIFTLDNRGTASLRMDYLRPATAPTHGDDRLRIAGTRGVVEFQNSTGVTLVTDKAGPAQVTDLPQQEHLFLDFLLSIYAGRKHILTPDEIFRVNEIVLKARDAAEKGRIVQL
jgi:predicted dehydrogenase